MPSKTKIGFLFLIIGLLLFSCAPASQIQSAPNTEQIIHQIQKQSQDQARVWFDALPEKSALTSKEEGKIAAWIFTYINKHPVSSNVTIPFINNQPSMVFLSLSDGSTKALVLNASGLTLQSAIDMLLDQIDDYLYVGWKAEWAKIDFVKDVFTYDGYALTAPETQEASLFGLAFESSSGIALLPEVLVAETIINGDREFRLSNLLDYWVEKAQPVDFLERLESVKTVLAYRFSTSGYFYENGNVLPLYRGHRTYGTFTPDDLLSAAINGGDYLIDSVKDDGRFVYSYLPKSDQESEDYNILRHAGTIYAMADLYQETGDQRLLDAMKRAVGFLGTYIRRCPVSGGFENCIVEEDEAKLGGTALAVLAFTQYMQSTGEVDLLEETRSLARWIVSTQNASGEFKTHKLEYPSGKPIDFNSQYYPGEAVYALARLYTLDKNTLWLSSAAQGAKWLAHDRIQGKTNEEIIHDHWLLLGLNELQHLQPDPIFIESAQRIADAIIAAQNIHPEFPDWFGSFNVPPRSTPTATRSEGLLAAYRIMRDFGTREQADRIFASC